MNYIRFVLSVLGVSALLTLAQAQVSVVNSGAIGNQVNLGAAYAQSFDSLAYTNTAPVAWVNNVTLQGWYAYRQSIGLVTTYNASQKTSPFGSFGIIGNTDRALGSSLNGGQDDVLYFGVQFFNASSSLITGFDISFDGEQWFYGDSFPGVTESLDFSYQIFDAGAGSISAESGWISVDELKFVSPINNVSPILQPLNGNLTANREAGIAESFTGLTLASGQVLWLRWTASDISSITDNALAIDNLSVTFHAVPEPATYAAMVGGIVLLVAWRRRRR